MTSKGSLLLFAALSLAAPARAQIVIDKQPLLVTNVTGTLRVQQDLPSVCSDIDVTTPVTAGRIEMTPWRGRGLSGGGRAYDLIRASAVIAPFTLHASCDGPDQSREYSEAAVQLAIAAPFTALPAGADVYQVTIPKELVRVYEAAIADDDLEVGYKHPKEDVTATLNYPAGTVQMRVVLATKIHIDECIPFVICVDDDFHGTLTAEVSGTIEFPDSDGDGIPDPDDNCRLVPNRDQSSVATPLLEVPRDVTVGSCQDRAIGRAFGLDLCDLVSVVITSDLPAALQPGVNPVTWTVQDAAGRAARATQTVTVRDTTRPRFTSVPIPLALDNCGGAALGVVTAADDCAGAPIVSHDAPRSFAAGRTVVHWSATDVSGNRATANQTVTVTDRVAPAAACLSADPDEGGEVGAFYQVSAHDACDRPAIRLGGYLLADGERIQITHSREPGVVLLETPPRTGLRHFRVGPGEDVIRAVDRTGNVGTAACGGTQAAATR